MLVGSVAFAQERPIHEVYSMMVFNFVKYVQWPADDNKEFVIGVVGVGDVTACLESLEATPGVERAVRISAPYKFVSKEFKQERTQMHINGLEIGGSEFIVMAGPCSVESERQIMETAEGVREERARLERLGLSQGRLRPREILAEFAKELDWFRPWKKVLDWKPPKAKWFVGGKLNASVASRSASKRNGSR